ncbi:FtsJ-like methyltransferase-domain-containing protein [Chytriomyces sp. MP71]|nr:FtsJ-like methyltransferase-domain-containing protein [Chytriomyces sp. MP71]
MSSNLYSNTDAKYASTPAESPIPPPRMEPPPVFMAHSRGGRGGYRERRESGFHPYRSDRERDSHHRDTYRERDQSRDHRDYRDHRDHRDQQSRPEAPGSYPQSTSVVHQQRLAILPSIAQSIEWLDNSIPLVDTSILSIDVKKCKLPDYDLFCYTYIIANQLNPARSALASLSEHTLASARNSSNAFALVEKSFSFINRAAVKLANLDFLTGFMVSASLVDGGRLAGNFVDLCAGPGGFSEYLLHRLEKSHHARGNGYGITLRGELDFDATLLSRGGLTPYYGRDGSGDLTKLHVLEGFVDFVKEQGRLPGMGITLVVADGAFSCVGDELYQEDQVKQVLLAEVLAMFKLLNQGGTFVVKTFELLTPFSASLVCSANSERYLVCHNLLAPASTELLAHLTEALVALGQFRAAPPTTAAPTVSSHTAPPPGFTSLEERVTLGLLDVYSVVDVEAMMRDEAFVDWIKESNTKISMKQTDALKKIDMVAKGASGVELYNQKDVAARCLQEWGL